MLSTLGSITYVPVSPVPSGPSKSPDFLLGSEDATYVEVCCLRQNDDEADRQEELDELVPVLEARSREAARQAAVDNPGKSARATTTATLESRERAQVSTTVYPLPDGHVLTSSIEIREIRPQGPDKEGGAVHTIASRIAGKKVVGQVPVSAGGVLWMDCCDSSWPLTLESTQPVVFEWKEINLATTQGVWHAFYGQKGLTPMMARSPVGLELPMDLGDTSLQLFPGRFWMPEASCWSAAVVKCVDGFVIFENPNAARPLPFSVLRGLTSLRGYCSVRSLHRYSDDATNLGARIADAEELLRYMAFGDGRQTHY
jgi:hypothetical protein